MLLYDYKQLAFCKPRQDRYWTSMDLGSHPVDITCYRGRFYAVSHNGRVSVFDIENPTKEAKTEVVVPRLPRELLVHISPGRVKYLVESAGDLLVVSAHEEGYEPAPKFRVFKVPLRDGNWQLDSEVKDLGNRTLFLGDNNTSFSVVASDYSGCEPNCIYFFSYISQQYIYSRQPHNTLLPSRENIDIGIFHMKNGRIQEHFYWEQRRFPTFGTPCLWIQPKFLEGNSCFAPTTNKVTGSYRKVLKPLGLVQMASEEFFFFFFFLESYFSLCNEEYQWNSAASDWIKANSDSVKEADRVQAFFAWNPPELGQLKLNVEWLWEECLRSYWSRRGYSRFRWCLDCWLCCELGSRPDFGG
ncbi:uncharacterized protein LOC117636746 [Prunus dulcis]|uniref:uncharacterized protein LOC117636746 n=1 Tax=Prunus dulcis TaxID=3755 RepID=UPI001482EE11|nr:uncharacterized protein LOC117636746 [Prunus dulcis]